MSDATIELVLAVAGIKTVVAFVADQDVYDRWVPVGPEGLQPNIPDSTGQEIGAFPARGAAE